MPFFVKATHWQIATMQVIPILCIYLFGSVFSAWQLGFMWILLISVTVTWLYSIGSTANQRLEPSLQKNPLLFKISALAIILVFIAVMLLMNRSIQLKTPPPGWLIYLFFAGLGSFFYTLWYAAIQFVTAEKKSQAFYIEYAFPMLGLWFGFVGAWFLQPRINRALGDPQDD